MTTPRPIVVGLGELLWDLFPSGKQLGGAPANFAYITALLGDSGIVASRVGDDRLGQEALWHLKSSGLDVSRVQRDLVSSHRHRKSRSRLQRPARISDHRKCSLGFFGIFRGLDFSGSFRARRLLRLSRTTQFRFALHHPRLSFRAAVLRNRHLRCESSPVLLQSGNSARFATSRQSPQTQSSRNFPASSIFCNAR